MIKDFFIFDGNLVFLASNTINSGIFGYRSDQEIRYNADFIEYLTNDSSPE